MLFRSQNQPLSPAEQGFAAAAAGLKYFNIPVNSADPKREQVEAVRTALEQINGPVFVHCQGGGRACTMALLVSEPNFTPEQTMKQAETAGFPITNPVSVQFVAEILGRKSRHRAELATISPCKAGRLFNAPSRV